MNNRTWGERAMDDERVMDEHMMDVAIQQARRAAQAGDVPVGAVIVQRETREIVAHVFNTREAKKDPTGHAEIAAIREAAFALGRWRLVDCSLYVTLEPCTMCAGAIVAARIPRVVFGAWDAQAGAAGSLRDVLRDSRGPYQVEVIGGVRETECEAMLRGFFALKRDEER
ncbi:MAG: tRNA adenosine(34) deaminase TadA [Actinomycetaceae bacterium]|nr:tRNA adenosine(34) deaminase TadA [Actinomycetaceae bacterium]MDY6082340.1 tRNA adenosine(34) deaminase TadA [Actinomycetaceae bacterium]